MENLVIQILYNKVKGHCRFRITSMDSELVINTANVTNTIMPDNPSLLQSVTLRWQYVHMIDDGRMA